jgi:hypothetical protein
MNPRVAFLLLACIAFSIVGAMSLYHERINRSWHKHNDAWYVYEDSAMAHIWDNEDSAFDYWQTKAKQELEIQKALIDIQIP